MTDKISAYVYMKRAIDRAEEAGYKVEIHMGYITLNPNGNGLRLPSFHFYTPEEIHCYLNGIQDGKFSVEMKNKNKT